MLIWCMCTWLVFLFLFHVLLMGRWVFKQLQPKRYMRFISSNTKCSWVMVVDHLPTMDWDRPILAKLLFCFMYLANEINEAFSWFWHSLFRPVCELKLPYCPWLSILGKRDGKRERTYKWNITQKYGKLATEKNSQVKLGVISQTADQSQFIQWLSLS